MRLSPALLLTACTSLCLAAFLSLSGAKTPPLFNAQFRDEQLVERIHTTIPALRDAAVDDFTKVCLLREWLSRFVPSADASAELDLTRRYGVTHHSATTAQLLAWSERRTMGMQCGGLAEIAHRVYKLLGYDSIVLNFGDPETGATHVTTLVRITTRNGPEWSMQDVAYNFTLLDESGGPLGFKRMLDRIGQGRKAAIQFHHPGDSWQLSLYPDSVNPFQVPTLAARSPRLIQQYSGHAAYAMKVEFRTMLSELAAYRNLLKTRFGDPDPTLLFLLPLSCSGESVALEMMEEAHRTRALISPRTAQLNYARAFAGTKEKDHGRTGNDW